MCLEALRRTWKSRTGASRPASGMGVQVHVVELVHCVCFCDSCPPRAGPGVGFQESSLWCSGDSTEFWSRILALPVASHVVSWSLYRLTRLWGESSTRVKSACRLCGSECVSQAAEAPGD